MADIVNPSEWAYTSVSSPGSVVLTINGVQYNVVSLTVSYAVNQIPEAVCYLALGRSAHTNQPAPIHLNADSLTAMLPASISVKPQGKMYPGGPEWPSSPQVIFSGYFAGASHVKNSGGKIVYAVNLLGWPIDLCFSSMLSAESNPANPVDFTMAVVFANAQGFTGGSSIGAITSLPGVDKAFGDIKADVWTAIYNVFCSLTTQDTFAPECGTAIGAATTAAKNNTAAQTALAKFEVNSGIASKCGAVASTPYKYGQSLVIDSADNAVTQGLANWLMDRKSIDLVNLTFWDSLVNYIGPAIGLDVLPAADRAIVAASLPAYRAVTPWKTIQPQDCDFINQTSALNRPIRSVVVHGAMTTNTGLNSTSAATSVNSACQAGVFTSKNAADIRGTVLYAAAPPWLGYVVSSGSLNVDSTGSKADAASNSATTPGEGSPALTSPGNTILAAQTTMNSWAQFMFVNNFLQGRSGVVSGRLRFDIAPGSQIKVSPTSEVFLSKGSDQLASNLYAQVNRVTVEIDAEGRRASTSFAITHLRNDQENQDDRSSAATHPIYGKNVCVGFPLVPAYNL